MNEQEKIKLELDGQNFLFGYWKNAEKYELGAIAFIFGVVIIPFALNTTLGLYDWTTWAILLLVIGIIFTSVKRLNYYNGKQKKIREIVENLKI